MGIWCKLGRHSAWVLAAMVQGFWCTRCTICGIDLVAHSPDGKWRAAPVTSQAVWGKCAQPD
jgi:hypothetical protein